MIRATQNNYNRTIRACMLGYLVQPIVINFAPLLFLTFRNSYHIPLPQITMLVTLNFVVQLLIDLFSALFVDKIGVRRCIVAAYVFSAIGFVAMAILPEVLPLPYIGLLISTCFLGIGGGLTEVMVSPIVEACPTENKEKAMSMLHSSYCWGYVAVIIISTLFFSVLGIQHWRILAMIWAIVPIYTAITFVLVPIPPIVPEGEKGLSLKELTRKKVFWSSMILMVCAGSAEMSVCQWASALAESNLGVSKSIGDLAGPMMFAVLMGVSRSFFGKFGDRINLSKYMIFNGFLCVLAYLLISFSKSPVLGLAGCALCGFSVGIMWPGCISLSARSIKGGGTAMFALLALSGDLGNSIGPTIIGMVSGSANDNLQIGILASIIFPIVLLALLIIKNRKGKGEINDRL